MWSIIAVLSLGLAWWIIARGIACPSCGYNPFITGIPGALLAIVGIGAAIIALVRALRLARSRESDRAGLWLLLLTLAAAFICGALLENLWNADTVIELGKTTASHSVSAQAGGHWWLTAWSVTLAITAVSLATLAIDLYWSRRLPLRIAMGAIVATLVVLTAISSATAPVAGQTGAAPQLTITEASAPATDCLRGTYPLVTIATSGGGTLVWSAQADPATPVTISPASGALGAGQQQTVTVSGVFHPTSAHPAVVVTFTPHGASDQTASQGSQAVTFSC
ncbi:MAG TPA: hypothetical protein VF808_06395 [Ktedonobacterales bacterium]